MTDSSNEGHSSTICIVPARGHSPDLPKKNIKPIDGKPLVAHTIETAIESDSIDDVFVSTESERIAQIATDHDARVPFLRPRELAKSDISLRPVIEHAVDEIPASCAEVTVTPETAVIILQPNLPFRRTADIGRAVTEFERTSKDAVVSVARENSYLWRDAGDDLSPQFSVERRLHNESQPVFRETGSITVTSPRAVRAQDWPGSSPGYVVTDRLSSFKIDTLIDFWLAEKIAEGPSVVIRTDGGGDLGLGKVYRAMTIATELEDIFGCEITFVSDEAYEDGVSLIRSHGFDAKTVSNLTDDIDLMRTLKPDVVLVDVPDIEERYHDELHGLSAAVVDFENVHNGDDAADFVINPQRHLDQMERDNYLNGPEYLVLRDEFHDVKPTVPETAENVLLTFGGTDPLGLTVESVSALGHSYVEYTYRVVLGPGFDGEAELRSLPEDVCSQFDFRRDVDNMGELMQWADVAISSGGRTVYELAATGTPAIVIAQNEGEVERMELLRRHGVIQFLGHGESVDFATLPAVLDDLAKDAERRSVLSSRGRELIDGQGLQRILETIERMFVGS